MLGLGLGLSRGGFVAQLPPPPLDTYTGAAAAYSLRKLRSDYTGAAIRVRESATNTEADIGFNADGTLNTTALLAHCGANNGFVVTWYDQSGNGNDATQATAASQPQIVSSGSVITDGKPSLSFNSSFLLGGNILNDVFAGANANFSHWVVGYKTSNGALFSKSGDSTQSENQRQYISSIFDSKIAAAASYTLNFSIVRIVSGNTNLSTTTASILGTVYDGSIDTNDGLDRFAFTVNSNIQSNIMQVTAGALDDSIEIGTAQFAIGAGSYGTSGPVSGALTGKLQEIIIYGSNQSSNRTAIESNINDYYSIYP